MSDEIDVPGRQAAPEPEGYDVWFREQVEAARLKSSTFVSKRRPAEEVNARMDQERELRDRDLHEIAS